MWINHFLSNGIDNFELELFELTDALQMHSFEADYGFVNHCGIETYLLIFGILHWLDIFKYLQVLLIHHLFQARFDIIHVDLADMNSCHIDSNIIIDGL